MPKIIMAIPTMGDQQKIRASNMKAANPATMAMKIITIVFTSCMYCRIFTPYATSGGELPAGTFEVFPVAIVYAIAIGVPHPPNPTPVLKEDEGIRLWGVGFQPNEKAVSGEEFILLSADNHSGLTESGAFV